MERRSFIKNTALGCLGLSAFNLAFACNESKNEELWFKISLAQWSLHRTLFSGKLTTLDFPAKAKNDFGIDAVEYVNTFFKDKALDKTYLNNLLQRTTDLDVKNLLIMVDGEGELGNTDSSLRLEAVEKHYKWVTAAKHLGCHSIRVNAKGNGNREETKEAAIDGLHQLSTFAKNYDINVIVENHGGLSSDGKWLTEVMKGVNLDNCGTLPDFGNFYDYDRYQGVQDMLPFAKGISAKTNNFNEQGEETQIDYLKMLKMVKAIDYTGYIGIEYEGPNPDENLGIQKTKELLITKGKLV